MSRIRIDLPEKFSFTTQIPVRITDLNYGGHVGNDTILSMIHEARVQFLHQHGYTSELDVDGIGLIMSDAGIEFKNEIFYGDTVIASVAAASISRVGFDLYYKLEKNLNNQVQLVAAVKTGMLCFDYEKRKLVPVPDELKRKLEG